MKLSANGLKASLAIAAIGLGSICQAQTAWIEDFEHNDPGLYTNLNGGPDNFDVVNGRAEFSGAGGSFWGRLDLNGPVGDITAHTVGSTESSGKVGFGYTDSTGSLAFVLDYDAGLYQLVDFTGFGWNVLSSEVVPQQFLAWEARAFMHRYWPSFGEFGWSIGIMFWDPVGQQWEQLSELSPINPSHEMWFGSGGYLTVFGDTSAGENYIGEIVATVPEPGTTTAFVIGLGLLWISRRRVTSGLFRLRS